MGVVRDLFDGVSAILFKDSQGGHALGTVLVDTNGDIYAANSLSTIGYVSGTTDGIDSSTQSLQVVDYPHHELHRGNHYFVDGYVSLDTGGVLLFTVVTPDTPTWAHMLFNLVSTQQTFFGVFEGGSISATGTVVTPRNNNRNYPDASVLKLYRGSTIGATGTGIIESLFGVAGNPAQRIGGNVGRDDELILKQNTVYHFLMQSKGDGNVLDFLGYWYEHSDKNK